MDESALVTDKLNHQYMIRIPEVLKLDLDKLSAAAKKRMNLDILVLMARAVHDSKFNPRLYLSSE